MTFTSEQQNILDKITEYMLSYNQKVNLTRITSPSDIYKKHYLDSAIITHYFNIKENASLIDVGTGAGFPGIILKTVRPDIKLTLLDSLKKRIDYLSLLLEHIDIKAEVLHSRAQEAAKNINYFEKFDVAIARAVAPLSELLELCLPFVKVGGVFLAMKGEKDELPNARDKIKELGGEVQFVKNYALMNTDKRSLIVIKKIINTKKQYPNFSSKRKKAPL